MNTRPLIITLALFAFAASGCATRQLYVAHGQDRAAGADGDISIERQETGNFVVETAVDNLLPPERFGDGLSTYVVWFQGPEDRPHRVGHLSYDERDRSGEMMATTAYSSFNVIITGEMAADVVSPSENVVFRARVESP